MKLAYVGAGAAFWICLTTVGPYGFAHKGEHHGEAKKEKPQAAPVPEDFLKAVNAAYVQDVKPIFQTSCFDCHSSNTRYPWYAKLPVAKGIIQSDIDEAKEHLDMSGDFPFKGHGTPAEDLEAIRDSVQGGDMPPFRYVALHWGSRLKKEDKDKIIAWAEDGLKRLEQK